MTDMTSPSPQDQPSGRKKRGDDLWLIDMSRLTRAISTSETTIEEWIKKGTFPAPKMKGGKRYWKWSAIEEWFDKDDTTGLAASPEEALRERTRRISQGR